MKIVNVIITSQNGGAEQVFIDYMIALKNLGHEVFAIVKEDAPYAKTLEELGIGIKKITNKFGYHDIGAIKKISKTIEEFDADITVSHMGRSVSLVRKSLARISNKKILEVAVNHSMNVKRSIGADVILSVNKEIFYKTIDGGQKEDASFVIHNAISIDDMAQKYQPLQDKEIITIGAMGRIDETKGVAYLIKAIKELEEFKDKKFHLKIAGSGPKEDDFKKLTSDLNLNEKVEFCGWINDKKSFFDQIDIFCLASDNETFGLVLLEAMKYKKPIIATASDGAKEVLRDDRNAAIISLENKNDIPNQIAKEVIKIISDDTKTKEMVENSAIRLQEKFSYQSLEKVLGEVFGTVK